MPLNRRTKMNFVMTFLILSTGSLYYILTRVQQTIDTSQFAQDKCTAELDKARFELSVITDDKNDIDQALTDAKQLHEKDKKHFEDILNSCLAMKFQCNFCQTQFQNLEMECKTIREQLSQLNTEVDECKKKKDLPGFG